jgi:hypothetical protein
MNQQIDLIYFWSSLVLVALPLGIFSWLSYLVIRGYRRERGQHNPR